MKLEIDLDPEDLAEFHVIGIVSSNYLYQTAFWLNQELKIFLKQPVVFDNNGISKRIYWERISKKKDYKYTYEWLTYTNTYEQTWDLIANRSFSTEWLVAPQQQDLFGASEPKSDYLIPKQKNIDQWMLLPQDEGILSEAMKVLKNINGVQAISHFPLDSLPNLEDLVWNRPEMDK